jgi:hypothetical protein
MNSEDSIKTYIRAIANEIYVDQYGLIDTGLNHIIDYELIRTYHIAPYARKYPLLIKVFLCFFIMIWPIGHYIWVTLQFLFVIAYKIFKQRTYPGIKKNLILLFSSRFPAQLEKVKKVDLSDCLYISYNKNLSNKNGVLVKQIISMKLLLKAYKIALRSLRELAKLNVKKVHLLQSYTAFPWFCTYYALAPLQFETIWFGNHYDRWAILFDSLKVVNKHLVQHGIENAKVNPPSKLLSVTTIYFISACQYQYFDKKIAVSEYKKKLLSPGLTLSPITEDVKANILIIGCISLTEDKETYIIQHVNYNKVNLYVKPHPGFSKSFYEKISKQYPFILIEDKDFFPKVNLVISYFSTLAVEYQQTGIDVLYYSDHSLEILLDKINNPINA